MGFIPSGIHHENIAGLEVVLANGDVVRTGQFAMTSSPSAHLTHLSFGPSIDGLFLQSNLGIVTKLGIHMTPQPQAYMPCTFDMPDFDDIETSECLIPLTLKMSTAECEAMAFPRIFTFAPTTAFQFLLPV